MVSQNVGLTPTDVDVPTGSRRNDQEPVNRVTSTVRKSGESQVRGKERSSAGSSSVGCLIDNSSRANTTNVIIDMTVSKWRFVVKSSLSSSTNGLTKVTRVVDVAEADVAL